MKIEEKKLESFWQDIPVGKNNAVTYPELIDRWGRGERAVRAILHELSYYDNGDNYILVRSGGGKGFYKTDDLSTIAAFREECLSKGRSMFAPIRKMNRVLHADGAQFSVCNNLRAVREEVGLRQSEVCNNMKSFDRSFDESLLSKMENDTCLPTPSQLSHLAAIYGCNPAELLDVSIYPQ